MFNLRGDGDVDDFVLGWKCPALLAAGLETERDRFLDVRERFFASASLTDASGDNWAFRDNPSVLTRTKHNWKLHAVENTGTRLLQPAQTAGSR